MRTLLELGREGVPRGHAWSVPAARLARRPCRRCGRLGAREACRPGGQVRDHVVHRQGVPDRIVFGVVLDRLGTRLMGDERLVESVRLLAVMPLSSPLGRSTAGDRGSHVASRHRGSATALPSSAFLEVLRPFGAAVRSAFQRSVRAARTDRRGVPTRARRRGAAVPGDGALCPARTPPIPGRSAGGPPPRGRSTSTTNSHAPMLSSLALVANGSTVVTGGFIYK